MTKVLASEVRERVCSAAIQIHGSNGCASGDPVEKDYHDARVRPIDEGTSDGRRPLAIRRRIAPD